VISSHLVSMSRYNWEFGGNLSDHIHDSPRIPRVSTSRFRRSEPHEHTETKWHPKLMHRTCPIRISHQYMLPPARFLTGIVQLPSSLPASCLVFVNPHIHCHISEKCIWSFQPISSQHTRTRRQLRWWTYGPLNMVVTCTSSV
jgi:hypothetical protein